MGPSKNHLTDVQIIHLNLDFFNPSKSYILDLVANSYVSKVGAVLQILIFVFFLHSSPVYAQSKIPPIISPKCHHSTATSTIYFTPTTKNMCPYNPNSECPAFRESVSRQGSGRLANGKVLRANGSTVDESGCPTAIGAAGECLTPYISVAADPDHYYMGEIISMPSLKDRIMTRSDGTTFKHPGYLIVQDVGGGIKGLGRFDLYTGTSAPKDPTNSFQNPDPLNGVLISSDDSRQYAAVTSTCDHTNYTNFLKNLCENFLITKAKNCPNDNPADLTNGPATQ